MSFGNMRLEVLIQEVIIKNSVFTPKDTSWGLNRVQKSEDGNNRIGCFGHYFVQEDSLKNVIIMFGGLLYTYC